MKGEDQCCHSLDDQKADEKNCDLPVVVATCFLLGVIAVSDVVELCCSLKAGRLRVWILLPSRLISVD